MNYKWLGAILVVTGCGSMGFLQAFNHKQQERYLRQLERVLRYMECELQYRLTPLPALCGQASKEASGAVKEIFLNLSREMERQILPDTGCCMTAAIKQAGNLPDNLKRILLRLGYSLGRFDLTGQLQGLRTVRAECDEEMQTLLKDRDTRIRNFQTLGLCTGAALAILFV